MKKIVRIAAGIFLILLGIVGLFLPVLQGILFIAMGLFLLQKEIPYVSRLLNKLVKRYPSLGRYIKRDR